MSKKQSQTNSQNDIDLDSKLKDDSISLQEKKTTGGATNIPNPFDLDFHHNHNFPSSAGRNVKVDEMISHGNENLPRGSRHLPAENNSVPSGEPEQQTITSTIANVSNSNSVFGDLVHDEISQDKIVNWALPSDEKEPRIRFTPILSPLSSALVNNLNLSMI